MKRKSKIILWATVLIVCVAVILLITCLYENYSFKKSMQELWYGSNEQILLSYKDVTINMSEYKNADFTVRLEISNRERYWKDINHEEDHFNIIIPDKIMVNIFHNTEDTIILEIKKDKGFFKKYQLSGYGGFDQYCDLLYEITKNDIFLAETRAQ